MLASCFMIALSSLDAQTVSQYAGSDTTLEGRWKWAIIQLMPSNDGGEYWIGYSIKRLMDDDSYIVSGNLSYGTTERRGGLYALLRGQQSVATSESTSVRSERQPGIFKRLKDVALLFLISQPSTGEPFIQDVKLFTMDLSFNLKNRPLLWLGGSGEEESIHLLKDLFAKVTSVKEKKDLVEAIGLHQHASEAFSLLSDILSSKESDDVRARAALWMGELGNPEGMTTLKNIAEKDQSVKVREEAVFAINRLDTDESTDVLISLARKADDPKVRGKAAFWLGQKVSEKAVTTLEDIIADDEETEVQRQALFALSEIKNGEAVERLIRIAKNHPNPRIRKQAIQILSQSNDPKALETLIEIVRK
jgi:thioredoxin-like negative regulator of GroEL